MKVMSAYDLLLAEPLLGMTQFDLVHLDNLDKVNDVLETLGFNTKEAIHVYAARHRTMTNEVKVGYIFAGELSLQRKHITGPYSHPDDFMIAATMQDESLFEELYGLQNRCNDYGATNSVDRNLNQRDNDVSDEERQIVDQINQLEEILFHIRGSQRNPDGSVKTAEDYKGPEKVEQKRLRRKSVKKVKGE